MATLLPPLLELTPENNGPAIVVVGYTLIIVTILFCVIRVAAGFILKRQSGLDDALIILAVAIGLAQTIVVERAAVRGIGRHIDALSDEEFDSAMKLLYASNILWVIAQAFAKSSFIQLMYRLSSAISRIRKFIPVAHGAVAIWGVFAIFAIAFQCEGPSRWQYSPARCNSGALWYAVIILNILTDFACSVMFTPVVMKLQMRLHQRLTVALLFAIRLVVCFVSIAQLAVLAGPLKAADTTRAFVVPVILGQCVMNLSILTAAGPSLHRVLNELHSHGFASDIPMTQYERSQQRSGNNNSRSWRGKSKSEKKGTDNPPTIEDASTGSRNNSGKRVMDFRPDLSMKSQNIVSHDAAHNREQSSRSSGDGSEDMIIRRTQDWKVTYDDHDRTSVTPTLPTDTRY